MEFLRIQMVVFLMIFLTSLTVDVHGREEFESDTHQIIAENLKDENSVQMKQKHNETSPISINVLRGIRGLEVIVSNLTKKLSNFEYNLLGLQNVIRHRISYRHLSKLNETLRDIQNFAKTEYQRMKSEILPRVRHLEDTCALYEDVVDINNTFPNYRLHIPAMNLRQHEVQKNANTCESIQPKPCKEDNVYECESKYLQQYVPCKEGWFLYGDKCYKFFGEKKNWNESSESCAVEGGHLATVSSKELEEFLVAAFLLLGRSSSWIGLTSIKNESIYTWQDGSDLCYTNWSPGEPSLKSERCVEMIYGNPRVITSPNTWGYLGTWNDMFCDHKRSSICQMDKTKDVKALSPDPRFCSVNEGGGFKFQKSCYHIVRTKKSWEEAEQHCEENFSGHLVTILDMEVELFLSYALPNIREAFWIGIRKDDAAIQKWISGWHLVHNKLNRDLKDMPKGTCVLSTKKQSWAIADCSLEFPFICETTNIKSPVLKKAPEGWQCPNISKDWVDLEGESCYFFGTDKTLNWYEANYQCEKIGGSLASITSKEEERILQHYVITHREVFIGLRRKLSNKNQFEWVDGSKMEYENWEPGEPNNVNDECGEIYSDTMTWDDLHCYHTKGRTYICKTQKVPPSAI